MSANTLDEPIVMASLPNRQTDLTVMNLKCRAYDAKSARARRILVQYASFAVNDVEDIGYPERKVLTGCANYVDGDKRDLIGVFRNQATGIVAYDTTE